MNQLSMAKRAAVVRCLVEGNSIRSTVRITGAAKNTVTKLLVELGDACRRYHDQHVRGLKSREIQVDEIWSFIGMKAQHVKTQDDYTVAMGYGDAWTWTALDAESKLIVSYAVGSRDATAGHYFMQDVASRLTNRVQLTSDGHSAYLKAVPRAFGSNIDYAMLKKLYGKDWEGERRYSPPVCLGAESKPMIANPDPERISTSYVERQNLTMRMSMRRFTRLTNAFSKKLENHECAVALHFMHYNYCRKHQTLGTTPAVAAGIANVPWTVEELIQRVFSN